jgi:hypothetical protein
VVVRYKFCVERILDAGIGWRLLYLWVEDSLGKPESLGVVDYVLGYQCRQVLDAQIPPKLLVLFRRIRRLARVLGPSAVGFVAVHDASC